ncbi:hypothetical protein VaNZ11_015654 [Volvox africanus]|uniref:Dynein axonemal assembly factor 4 n=1 Tax=Volvox africanus TaxID=51714 RepID=A0ABQ5SLA9_9CHLO|nr:hypothetical protein VaNZ11_015654 [Volvox africanus]
MPLTPRYTWSETEASLEVTVDVPGVSRAKADVFATDAFLKVNYPPYLFALDLHKEVDDSRSSATIIPGKVVFQLFKRDPSLWGCLAASGDKAELTRRRNASIDRAYLVLEEARKARLARKQQEDKNATQRSMDVDRRKRQEMERRKSEELAEERGRLEEWQRGLQGDGVDAESDYEDEGGGGEGEAEGKQVCSASHGSDPEAPAAPDHPDYYGRGWRPPQASDASAPETRQGEAGASACRRKPKGASEDEGDDGGKRAKGSDGRGSSDSEGEGPAAVVSDGRAAVVAAPHRPATGVTFKPLPPPRARLQPVQVSFTKLETGHLPAREQREEDIRAFRKQARAAAEDDPDTIDIAERQPLFLKDKGDEMFKAGNYSGALNAYSRAIQLDDCHAAVRTNRAACRLALGEAAGCVEDCDRAWELLAERKERLDHDLLDEAEAMALRRQLVRLLVRRAQARVALAGSASGGEGGGEYLAASLRDYEEAMRLSPSDPSLESDYQELLAALRPADAAALRQRGDARFRSGDYEGAAAAFSALLGMPRSRVPESERLAAFSNRAACNLVLERYSAAVADCDAGLALLLPQPPALGSVADMGARSIAEFGAAAGETGIARLSAWARSLALPMDTGSSAAAEAASTAETSGSGGAGLAAAAAAAAAARLLARRGAAGAHLQQFAAAAADNRLAADLLMRLGETVKADAATVDAARMEALEEGREQLPPRPEPQPLQQVPEHQASKRPEHRTHTGVGQPSEDASPGRARVSAASKPDAQKDCGDDAERNVTAVVTTSSAEAGTGLGGKGRAKLDDGACGKGEGKGNGDTVSQTEGTWRSVGVVPEAGVVEAGAGSASLLDDVDD